MSPRSSFRTSRSDDFDRGPLTNAVYRTHRVLTPFAGGNVSDLKDGKAVPRKADRLNAELAKSNAYTAIDAKQVTAWLAIRNSAAHGDYAAYTSDQVRNLASGVEEFMVRAPT
jgi:hypothetical protein